jgi:DNA-binding FrmR family transcriptional regulator
LPRSPLNISALADPSRSTERSSRGFNLTHHKKTEVDTRLARIEGQVRGIRKMMEEGRTYSDVVHQLAATIKGLESVIQVIVDDLVEGTVATAEKKEVKEAIQELRDIIEKSI